MENAKDKLEERTAEPSYARGHQALLQLMKLAQNINLDVLHLGKGVLWLHSPHAQHSQWITIAVLDT